MLNPFAWIRAAARNAFLGGIGDALDELSADAGATLALPELAARLRALPAAPPRAAQDEPADEDDPEPAPSRRKRQNAV